MNRMIILLLILFFPSLYCSLHLCFREDLRVKKQVEIFALSSLLLGLRVLLDNSTRGRSCVYIYSGPSGSTKSGQAFLVQVMLRT